MSHRDGTDYDPIRCPVCGQPDFCRADCPELLAEYARWKSTLDDDDGIDIEITPAITETY